MNISGIRASVGFYEYNDIKSSELRSRQILEAKEAQDEKPAEAEQERPLEDAAEELHQDFTSYDYAKQYEPQAAYELKGKDSEIELLDIEKVLSDVKKDAVLQQYQFFVGEINAQRKEPIKESRLQELNFEL